MTGTRILSPLTKKKKKTLHPRIKLNGSVGTDVLRHRIQERCSLTETDVSAALDALSHIMAKNLPKADKYIWTGSATSILA